MAITPVLRFAPSVTLDPPTPAWARILAACDQAVRLLGRDLTVTCGREGHAQTDPHTRGSAIDVRTRDLPEATILTLYDFLKAQLGTAFTVLYEVKAKPNGVLAAIAYVNPDATAQHLHIQVRKKTTFPETDAHE
jgi:hypothetical protein